ncbi:MAG: methylamine dehydrogenase light chain [Panacagrimonas sp.]
MRFLDRFTEKATRRIAQSSSRRSFLTVLGTAMVGAGSMPLLPVARAAGGGGGSGVAPQQSTGNLQDPGDPASCDYWRYCAIDGFLCSCCGGTPNSCPPGTEMSPITWIGTCQNPADGRSYIISYNDCCGKSSCSRCLCNRNESDKPMVRPQANNDINWCLGTSSTVYNCSTAIILGVALEK